MSKSVAFRVSLQRDVVVLLLVFGALMFGTMAASTGLIVRRMSARLIDATLDQTEEQLRVFFRPVGGAVGFLGELVEAGELRPDDPESTEEVLRVALTQLPNISSVLLADEDGVETLVMQRGEGWYVRHTDPGKQGGASEVVEEDAEGGRTESVVNLGYSALERPWFDPAIDRYNETGPDVAARDLVVWTDPYEFFTSKVTGVTASAAFRAPDGRMVVVAADVALTEIDDRASEVSEAEHGAVLVVLRDSEDNWVTVGKPDADTFPRADLERYVVRRSPAELGIDLGVRFEEYLDAWERGDTDDSAVHIQADGRSWWANARAISLAGTGRIWFGVAVETEELTPWLWGQRSVVLVLVALALGYAVRRAKLMARRFSEPIEAIVEQSERISKLDLEEHERITSRVLEVDRLADAQDRMRGSLQTLIKLEGDLRLARQIQQQTLPAGWPELKGFDIAAWDEPAEETGGDSYDVIGCVTGESDRPRLADSGECELIYVLLADATGHGIGPALSVTQLRSMLRMGIRSGEDLSKMALSMNDQLCEDLLAGRFITAWLGEFDGAARTLRSCSAGQGPVLHYIAAEDRVDVLAVDAPPLGVMEGIEMPMGDAIRLGDGDFVLAMSDGIFEAMSPEMKQFGQARVEAIVREQRGGSAQAMINALQIALIDFCGGRPADDDRTVVVVKAV